MIGVTFRPLPVWPYAPTKSRRSRSTFRAGWSDTLAKLEYEVVRLRGSNIIVAAGFEEADLRRDSLPRADARARHPGVELSFDSRHGRLIYATDVCEFWQHNVRSIALGLAALRDVDRYGISERGQQYAGWKALPAGSERTGPTTAEAARALLLSAAGENADPSDMQGTYRAAARRTHPDAGGTAEAFQSIRQAWQLVSGL